MIESLRERGWEFVRTAFPERQIYIRSDGRVQFFVFGPLMQAILAGITLLFLGWVAFTSVNVVFKDRIIASKDRRYQQMQSRYESRVANLQLSYDELNVALVTTQDRFQSLVDDIEIKQDAISDLMERRQKLQATLGINKPAALASTPITVDIPSINSAIVPDENDYEGAGDPQDGTVAISPPAQFLRQSDPIAIAPPYSSVEKKTSAPLTSAPVAHSPSTIKSGHTVAPERDSFLHGAVQKLGTLFGRRIPAEGAIDRPAFREIAAQEKRVVGLKARQYELLANLDTTVKDDTARLRKALQLTGIKPDTLIARGGRMNGGMGGPLIPIPAAFTNDASYLNELGAASDAVDDMTLLVGAMSRVPLAQPVVGEQFDVTSGFGIRRDPFTKRMAFHSGLDFSGPGGMPVLATAPGTVVFSGARGGYGNTVEIDHGSGIRTRYGHLKSILVTLGSKVEKGAPIGRLGSTGRSTGPHVHYEVWFDDAVRDPRKFIKAGQYVLKE